MRETDFTDKVGRDGVVLSSDFKVRNVVEISEKSLMLGVYLMSWLLISLFRLLYAIVALWQLSGRPEKRRFESKAKENATGRIPLRPLAQKTSWEFV